ncbi:MAG: MotA/TolQ/ExbB proton channel family protein [Parvibaculales bacterium]
MLRNLIVTAFLATSISLTPALAQDNAGAQKPADEGISLIQLLDRVKQGRVTDNSDNKRREAAFLKNRDQQQNLLNRTNNAIKREEARSERLEQEFNENELKLAELEGLLQERLGVFGELFGIVRQVAGETKAQVESSIISGELPGREAFLEELSKTKGLPSMKQLEGLWYELQREMTAQGEVKTFEGKIVAQDGSAQPSLITRVGPFSAISEDEGFLRYSGEGRFTTLGRQPPARFLDGADALTSASAGELTAGVVDPSRGAILELFLQTPNLSERIGQGGLVGYVIISLGIIGVLMAFERILTLTRLGRSINNMLESGNLQGDNPLGRVWEAYSANRGVDVETLELKLDDAILKEMPALERGLSTIKLISGVAPLLGLLGTVTGMILTFQAITLFGTGDPKLMAGGISQALMTTVLGLVVAIPTLLLHSIASTRSKEVVQVLEEQATGLIAAHAETKGSR